MPIPDTYRARLLHAILIGFAVGSFIVPVSFAAGPLGAGLSVLNRHRLAGARWLAAACAVGFAWCVIATATRSA